MDSSDDMMGGYMLALHAARGAIHWPIEFILGWHGLLALHVAPTRWSDEILRTVMICTEQPLLVKCMSRIPVDFCPACNRRC